MISESDRGILRYGVSDVSVSAGRAEPIDEQYLQRIRTIFFEPVTRTPGSDPKEIVMSDPSSTSVARRLPRQPSLEQLKKQARELLERFRDGELAAVAEVRQLERNADPSHFALNDAQRVLARAYGFESWPKLKAFVDGVTIARFTHAVKAGDMTLVRSMLASRPELVGMDRAGNDEHRGLHYAVLGHNAPMVKLLMEAGADARKGIWPNRDATSALTLARDREYSDIVTIIEEEERLRREEMSCPNATVSPVQDQISAAILQGETATAKRMLEKDLSLIHACDRTGATPLHIAAQVADLDLVAWLLQRKANVRKQDMQGSSPLDRAAQSAEPRNDYAHRFPALARLLLDHGAETTICAAVALGDAERVREMIAANPAGLRRTLRNGGLLSLAVNHNQLEIVKLLLDLGADVDERVLLEELEEPTQSWGAPLWYAALGNQLEIARVLLDRGADPNANVYASGWPLSNAWNHEGGAIKRLLLEHGAHLQPHTVAANHDVAEARRLLEDNPSEHVMEELLWSAADHGCPEIVALALAQIQWPLHERTSHWVLMQPIRGAGGDLAGNAGHFASLDLILRKGIDPNVTRMGATTLHFAAARGGLDGVSRARFAAMLIDRGARLDLRDDLLRSTPLGWACRWGRLEMAEVLIKRGALVEEPDAEPWAMPIAWAKKMNHSQILRLLDGNLSARTSLS
jgi:ankyrin repeat protein